MVGTARETAGDVRAHVVDVRVTEQGFEPNRIDATRGDVVALRFLRLVEHTCVKRVIIYLDDHRTIERELPKDLPVTVTLQLERPGEVGFSCAMAMRGGAIAVH